MTPLAGWTHAVADLPEGGLSFERTASPDACQAIAKALNLLACERLRCTYNVRPLGVGRVALSGRLTADVKQACVVTLAPVVSHIEERMEVEFWPEGTLSGATGGEAEILSGTDLEQIDNGAIDVGRTVFEYLSAALDPYPRVPGAAFDWKDPRESGDPGAAGPFAALAKLRGKR